MSFQSVFQRYELKYILTLAQKERIASVMKAYMKLDRYGRKTIRNIYYDTDTYLLIRNSIEKPVYKEKLRVRSYNLATPDSMVFVELKKKYKKIVYKRRLELSERETEKWLSGEESCPKDTQISREIDYFLDYYKYLQPKVFLSYEREAYDSIDGSDFRVTFDDTILGRQSDLSLQAEVYGESVLSPDKVLMEIKCSGGMPLWMTEILSELNVYKTSFSKYGTVYQKLVYPNFSKTEFSINRQMEAAYHV